MFDWRCAFPDSAPWLRRNTSTCLTLSLGDCRNKLKSKKPATVPSTESIYQGGGSGATNENPMSTSQSPAQPPSDYTPPQLGGGGGGGGGFCGECGAPGTGAKFCSGCGGRHNPSPIPT